MAIETQAHTTFPFSQRVARAETALIQSSLAGDGASFASLVKPHLPAMHRIAARMTGDSARRTEK